jgi:peroxiredoxin
MRPFKTFSLLGFILLLAAGFMLGQAQPQSQAQPQPPAPQEPAFRPALLEQPFPALSLPTYDGGQLDLATLRGKNVMIIVPRVYAAEGRWCTICNYQYAEAVEVEKTVGLRQKYDLEILYLFPFSREVVTQFLDVTPAQLEKIRGWKNPAEPDKLDAQGKEQLERRRRMFPKDLSLKEGEVPRPFVILLDPQRLAAKPLGVFAAEWNGSKTEQGIPTIFILDKNGILQFKYISQTTVDRPSFAYLMKILNMIGR